MFFNSKASLITGQTINISPKYSQDLILNKIPKIILFLEANIKFSKCNKYNYKIY